MSGRFSGQCAKPVGITVADDLRFLRPAHEVRIVGQQFPGLVRTAVVHCIGKIEAEISASKLKLRFVECYQRLVNCFPESTPFLGTSYERTGKAILTFKIPLTS